jgi:hypothetical protein
VNFSHIPKFKILGYDILGELIRCQSDHSDYACSHGGVAMLGGDGTDPSTRLLVARHAWVHVDTFCLV